MENLEKLADLIRKGNGMIGEYDGAWLTEEDKHTDKVCGCAIGQAYMAVQVEKTGSSDYLVHLAKFRELYNSSTPYLLFSEAFGVSENLVETVSTAHCLGIPALTIAAYLANAEDEDDAVYLLNVT